ncbi:hypothetical protein G3O08_14300 [Cryomorpha ignava]|uniref:Uncharacterized protein n=1 Tax=Cryomorpha ignava TaxID=101383 RepID=A0A7K3WVP3_9FLAO|nr:hypothetical protein [Cryomorpha ignava]NEN24675.1 hypothetical protein [Cryomorpha ignava]
MVLDTSAGNTIYDIDPQLGEVPLDSNNGQFRVWRYLDEELNKTNSYAANISELFLETYIYAENYVLPITARWDSSLFRADVLYEYGDPVNRAYFDNEYFFFSE